MRKHATPMTMVPGAQNDGVAWHMPKPSSFAEHTECDKKGRRKVQVPVYRGVLTSLAREIRAKQKREAIRRRREAVDAANENLAEEKLEAAKKEAQRQRKNERARARRVAKKAGEATKNV